MFSFSQSSRTRGISFFKFYIFIFGLLGVFLATLAALLLWCAGFWLQWLHLLQSMGCMAPGLQSRGSTVLAHSSKACGIFLDQGWNPCLLHWQVDSLLLSHRGSPLSFFLNKCSQFILFHRTTKEAPISHYVVSLFSFLYGLCFKVYIDWYEFCYPILVISIFMKVLFPLLYFQPLCIMS